MDRIQWNRLPRDSYSAIKVKAQRFKQRHSLFWMPLFPEKNKRYDYLLGCKSSPGSMRNMMLGSHTLLPSFACIL